MEEGKTILFVAHGVSVINELCSRAILLDRGELILEGPPKLVTLHYQKYLYANPAEQNKTRNEILLLNKNEEKKKVFSNIIESTGKKQAFGPAFQKEDSEPEKQKQALYLPELKSKSEVLRKNADIDIFEIRIEDPNGNKVNYLLTNEIYFLAYKVKFNVDVEDFTFSCAFKNEKGLQLSGARFPGQRGPLQKASINDTYAIKWKFRCSLLQGIYYIDIGISKRQQSRVEKLSAYFDALVFKVQKYESEGDAAHKWALFDMDQQINSIEIV